MDANTLKHQAQLAGFVIERNTESITHEDSLVQPEASGNCLNWVIGHIVRARIMQLQIMNKETPYDLEQYGAYDTEPVTSGTDAMTWDTLVEQCRNLQKPLEDALMQLTEAEWNAKAPFSPTSNPDETIGSLLSSFAFHEAYHAGQLGLLRRVCGKPGAIAPPKPEAISA